MILYRTLTMDRMWTLIEANTDVTTIVAEARRIRDTQEGWLKKLVLRSVGDFPHFMIGMGDNFGGEVPEFSTFANEGASPSTDLIAEERTSDFKISIIYETANFDKQDALEMAVIDSLENGGRNLGYTPIKVWGPWRARRNLSTSFDNSDVVRPRTEIIIPVKYEF